MLEVLSRLHGAHRKLLRAKQASLWVALHKLAKGAAQLACGGADTEALLSAIEGRSRQVGGCMGQGGSCLPAARL
jgi:hypothetical protein